MDCIFCSIGAGCSVCGLTELSELTVLFVLLELIVLLLYFFNSSLVGTHIVDNSFNLNVRTSFDFSTGLDSLFKKPNVVIVFSALYNPFSLYGQAEDYS